MKKLESEMLVETYEGDEIKWHSAIRIIKQMNTKLIQN